MAQAMPITTSFGISGSNLVTAASFDFETKSSYSIRLQTTDLAGATYQESFTIAVTDENEAPTALALSNNSLQENNSIGQTIGSLSATDADAAESFTYSFATGAGDTDNSRFSLSAGTLKAAEVFDFEAQNSFSIRLAVTDNSGAILEQQFTINATNQNEAPTAISLSNSTILELNAVGAVVGNFSTTDPDAGDLFDYSLVSGSGDSGNGSFRINGNALEADESFNYTTQNSYSIRVRAEDLGGLATEQEFVISISNVNTPPTGLTLSSLSVAENGTANQAVGIFSPIDADAGDSYTYALIPGAGDADNAAFTIDDDELQLIAPADFESKSSYEIRVEVTDGASNTYAEAFTIAVADVNEAPTAIALSNNQINENRDAGALVGAITVTDPDATDTHTFSLSGAGNDRFKFDGNQLSTAQQLNFEERSSYSFNLIATDAGGLSFSQPITIQVRDTDDAPRSIQISSNTIAENAAVGTLVGTLTTLDDDADDTHSYSMAAEGDNTSFRLEGDKLYSDTLFNFEEKERYLLTFSTTDAQANTLEQQLFIFISDTNDAPDSLQLSAQTIAENTTGTTTVGVLTATDADAADSVLVYSLTGDVADNAFFFIDQNELKTSFSFDFEERSTYTIEVAASDAAENSIIKEFTIEVLDRNDRPEGTQAEAYLYTLNERESDPITIDVAVLLNQVNASDQDADQSMGLLVTSIANVGSWQFSLNNGSTWQEIDSLNVRLYANEQTQLRLLPLPKLNGLYNNALGFRLWDGSDSTQQGFDYQTPILSGSTSAYSSSMYYIDVDLLPVNNAPVLGLNTTQIDILEDADKFSLNNFIIIADDGDPELEQNLQLQLTQIEESGNLVFEEPLVVDLAGRSLQFAAAANSNGSQLYELRLIDNGRNDLPNRNTSAVQRFEITVEAVNDAPAFAFMQDTLRLQQQFGTATAAIEVAAVPTDEQEQQVNYQLLSNTDIAEVLVAENGQLTLNSLGRSFGEFTLILEANDGQLENASFTDSLYVIIERVNTAPTAVEASTTRFMGNPALVHTVASLTAVDTDSLDSHTFTLAEGVADNHFFAIDENKLVTAKQFDYRSKNSFDVAVEVTDEAGESIIQNLRFQMELPLLLSPEKEAMQAVLASVAGEANLGEWTPGDAAYLFAGAEVQAQKLVALNLSGLGIASVDTTAMMQLTHLNLLDVSNNALNFEYLLPLSKLAEQFNYQQQVLQASSTNRFFKVGDAVQLTAQVSPVVESLQWYKGNEAIEGATSATFALPEIAFADSGQYYYTSRNSQFPELALIPEYFNIGVVRALTMSDSLALIAIRNRMDSVNQAKWPLGTLAANWLGVKVVEDRVVELDIDNRNLSGSLPPEIGDLSALTRLNLFGNNLTGTLQPTIVNLQQLTYLDVDNNNLSALPTDIGQMSNLRTLWAARNRLTFLPQSVGNLNKLEFLFVQNNELTDLPNSVLQLPELRLIDASFNLLSTIQQVNLPKLEFLKMSNNQLVEIHPSVGEQQRLQRLWLDNNNLRAVPAGISTLPALYELDVRSNFLLFGDLEALNNLNIDVELVPQRRLTDQEEVLAPAGTQLTLQANVSGTNNSYQWYRDGTIITGATSSQITFEVNQSNLGSYTALVTNSVINGLTLYSRVINVSLSCDATRSITITNGGTETFCSNTAVFTTLFSEVENFSDSLQLQWYYADLPIVTANQTSFIATQPGEYKLAVREIGGCLSFSNIITLKVLPAPEVDIQLNGEQLVASVSISGGSYLWYRDGFALEGATDSTYTPDRTGVYKVSYELNNFCEAFSPEVPMSVTGLNQQLGAELKLYPVPTNTVLHVALPGGFGPIEQLRLYNATGAEVTVPTVIEFTTATLQLASLPSGVYLLELHTAQGYTRKRVIKE